MAELPSTPTSDRALRILVIDDEERIAHLVQQFFTAQGHLADACCGGADALQRVRAQPWDVVLSDLSMKPMDGCTLAEQVKIIAPQTQVYIMTGNPEVRCPQFIDGVVRKPFTLQSLQKVLDAQSLS